MKNAVFFDASTRVGRLGGEVCARKGAGLRGLPRPAPRAGEEALPSPLADLSAAYEAALSEGLDAVLWCSGCAAVFDPAAAAAFLADFVGRGAVLGVRVSAVTGIALRHGPRLPCVDDNVLALNIRRAQELGFFRRKLINASHFQAVGGGRSVLLSLLEYACGSGEWENILDPLRAFGPYGDAGTFSALPFSLCTRTGTAVCDAEHDERLFDLLVRNAAGGGPFFLKRRDPVGAVLGRLRPWMYRLTNLEFRKTYDAR